MSPDDEIDRMPRGEASWLIFWAAIMIVALTVAWFS